MYLSEGKIYFNEFDIKTLDKIPNGNWLLCQNPMTGEFFLKEKPNFTLPKKIYGDVEEVAKKYLNSFNNSEKNLGILLDGMKGTGKSMLARKLCIDSNRPVIIVTEAYKGSGLVDFFSKINQEIVIFLDEFEKIYAKSEFQDGLLSLFDGAFPSKFLFLLTINEMSRMNNYMLNRPGRIHYVKHYKGLSTELIGEIVDDLLEDKSKKAEVMLCCAYLGELSMDMLTAFIWECNQYPEQGPRELLRDLNLLPEKGYWTLNVYRYKSKVSQLEVDKSPLSQPSVYVEFQEVDPIDAKTAEKMTPLELAQWKNKNYSWKEVEWDLKDCDVKVNKDSSIEISLKDGILPNDEDDAGVTLKYVKRTVYSYVF